MRARTQPVMRRIVVTGAILASIVAGGSYAVRMPRASINAPDAAPPTSVMVETLAPQKIRVWSEFSGRLHAVDSAEIRPEVGGRITEVRFEDGAAIKAGDVLFVIDPRPYQAALAKAEHNVASARTHPLIAQIVRDRAARK